MNLDSILRRVGLTRAASHDEEVRTLTARLEMVSRSNIRAQQGRERAYTFIRACRREGLIPDWPSNWGSHANCMTGLESEGDIERAIEEADALRVKLGPALNQKAPTA